MTFRTNRLIVPVAVLSAMALIAVWFPYSTLLTQSAQLSTTAHQIAVLQAESRSLHAQQSALSSTQATTLLAREEYQLVKPGQRLIQILNNGTGADGLGTGDPGSQPLVVPSNAEDLLPVNPTASTSSTARAPGLWSRVVRTLEFWR